MKKIVKKIILIIFLATSFNTNQLAAFKPNKESILITQEQKEILNLYLSNQIGKVLQIKATGEIAKQILEKIAKLEKENKKENDILSSIKDDKTKLLKAAKPLFEQLYSFKDLLTPLVEKILLPTEPTKKDTTAKDSVSDLPVCLLFFRTKDNESKDFFENILVNKEIIVKTCKELQLFSETIIGNLDEETLTKAADLAKKHQVKKK